MRLVVAVVGRPRHKALAEAITDFETRAARYWPLEVHEVKEEKSGSLSHRLVREREGHRLAERIPEGAVKIACDPGGRSRTSEEFSEILRDARDNGRSLAFLIGGAFGLSEEIRTSAGERLSLAPWTLPHELARLVLAEQLYRAGTIARHEPYHK